eukprot:Gb_28645 [translate_table: standard]
MEGTGDNFRKEATPVWRTEGAEFSRGNTGRVAQVRQGAEEVCTGGSEKNTAREAKRRKEKMASYPWKKGKEEEVDRQIRQSRGNRRRTIKEQRVEAKQPIEVTWQIFQEYPPGGRIVVSVMWSNPSGVFM